MCWNPCDRTGSLQTGFVRFERAMADPGPLTRRTVRCSSRWVWSSRLGLGGELDPGGRDGHSPSRRPGGPAPKRWQRRPRRPPVTPRGLTRSRRPRRAVIGGASGRASGSWPPGGRSDPAEAGGTLTANASGAEFFRGIEGGGAPLARAPVLYTGYADHPRSESRQEIT